MSYLYLRNLLSNFLIFLYWKQNFELFFLVMQAQEDYNKPASESKYHRNIGIENIVWTQWRGDGH